MAHGKWKGCAWSSGQSSIRNLFSDELFFTHARRRMHWAVQAFSDLGHRFFFSLSADHS